MKKKRDSTNIIREWTGQIYRCGRSTKDTPVPTVLLLFL